MLSIFDYLRRLVRDSVLAGVQDAFDVMDQGDHRDKITATARRFLDQPALEHTTKGTPAAPAAGVPTAPTPEPSATPEPRPRATASPDPAPQSRPKDLIPDSFDLPATELPRLDGFDQYERRKKGGSGQPGQSPKKPPQQERRG